MTLPLRATAVLILTLVALPARGIFHLWQIEEIYSNADGTQQYLELTALAGGQQVLSGHTLTAGGRTFQFPSNLPGDTTNKRMLIATTGFAALGLVAPDYVVPNNFFDIPSGSVNFANVDTWNYSGVPSDGTMALYRSGGTAERSPTNFAGETITPPRLFNISTRGPVQTGDNVMIGGFIIGGSSAKTVLIRARGPSMAQFGVPNLLANPQVQLFSGQNPIAFNDNWQDAANAPGITASGLAPTDPNESAILMSLNPGPYTAIVTGVGNTTGIAIVEAFEIDAVTVALINISTRGLAQTGDHVMIGGFIIQGSGPLAVVVRARGPSMAQFGVPNLLADPMLQLFSGQTVIASNDNWQQAPNMADIQATCLAPENAAESAILMTLQPGAYTAIVTGAGGGTGIGIVEVFKSPGTQGACAFVN